MATSLSGKSIGSPDNAFSWYLQSGGGVLATGFPVALGNGTETPLWLDSAGIGVRSSGGFVSKIASRATATRACEIADSAGVLYPAIEAKLASDSSNSTTTPATVPSFQVSLAASGLYEFDFLLLFQTALNTVSPRWTVNGPTSQTDFVSYEVIGSGATNAIYSAWGTAGANAVNAPASATTYAIRVIGACKMTGSAPTLPVTLDIFSETAATAITLKAGSLMRFRKIN